MDFSPLTAMAHAHFRAASGNCLSQIKRLTDGYYAKPNAAAIYVCIGALIISIFLPLIIFNNGYIAISLDDTLAIANFGYQLHRGVVPSLDFYSPLGTAIAAILSVGFLFTDNMFLSLVLSTFFFTTATAGIVAYVSLKKLLFGPALLFSTFAIVTLGVPVSSALLSFAEIYNRICSVILMLIAIICFSNVDRHSIYKTTDVTLITLLAAILCYSKISFGFVSFCFVGVYLIRGRSVILLGYSIALFIVVVLSFEIFFGFGFNIAYLQDLQVASRAFRHALHPWSLLHVFLSHYPEFLLGLFIIPIVAIFAQQITMLTISIFAHVLFFFAAVFVTATNAGGLTYLVVFPALMLGGNARAPLNIDQLKLRVILICLSVFIFLPYILGPTDVLLKFTLLMKRGSKSEDVIVVDNLNRLDGLIIRREGRVGALNNTNSISALEAIKEFRYRSHPGGGQNLGEDEYLLTLRDGLRILENCPNKNGIFNADFSNPFPFLMDAKQSGGGLWFDNNRTFNRESHPAVEKIFSGVDCVLIPRLPIGEGYADNIIDIYGSYIKAHFLGKVHSLYWDLVVREK